MRNFKMICMSLIFVISCAQNKKKDDQGASTSEATNPESEPGEIIVDENEATQSDTSITRANSIVDDVSNGSVVMTGTLILGYQNLVSEVIPDHVLAIPFWKSMLFPEEAFWGLVPLIQRFSITNGKFEGHVDRLDIYGTRVLRCIENGVINSDLCRTKFADLGGEVSGYIEAAIKRNALDEMVQELLNEEKNCGSNANSKFSCPKDYSRLLISYCADSKGDRVKEANTFKFLGVDAGGSNMINLPLGIAKTRQMDLGDISIGESEGRSSYDASLGFDLTNDGLRQLAATGAALKAAKNAYMNYDATKKRLLNITPDVGFWVPFAASTQYPDPDDISMTGFKLNLAGQGWDDLFVPDVICTKTDPDNSATRKLLTLQHSGDGITLNQEGNGKLATMSTANMVTPQSGSPSSYACSSTPDEGSLSVNFEYGQGWGLIHFGDDYTFKGAIPGGNWTLSSNSEVIGTFDLSTVSPLRDNKPIAFMPLLRIDTNESGDITDVKIRFAYYDSNKKPAAGWTEVTDTAAMKIIQDPLEVGVSGIEGCTESENISEGSRPMLKLKEIGGSPKVFCFASASNGNLGSCFDWSTLKLRKYSSGMEASGTYKRLKNLNVFWYAFGVRHFISTRAVPPSTSCADN